MLLRVDKRVFEEEKGDQEPVGASEPSSSKEDVWGALDKAFDVADGMVEEPSVEVPIEPAKADDEAKTEEPKAEQKPEVEQPKEAIEPESKPEPSPEPQASPPEVVEPKPVEPVREPEKPAEQVEEQPKPVELTVEQRTELRRQARDQLAEQYKLGQEEADQYEASPAAYIPTLAANLHLQIKEDVINTMVQAMPQLVGSVVQQRTVAQEKTDRFYEKWPDLREFGDQVTLVGRMWREMNPKADEATAIKEIGRIATAAFKVEAPKIATAPEPTPTPTPAVQPPVQKVKVPPKETNPFTQLNEEWTKLEAEELND